jgi:hypothetical protein
LANAVCRAVQTGGSPPLIAHPTAEPLESQATAALPAALRTPTSLQRVGVRTSRSATVGPLIRDYDRLIGLYSSATRGVRGSRSAVQSIRLVEQQIEVDARRAGVPVCAGGGP